MGKGILHPQPCGIRGRRDNLSESISTDSRTASKLINEKAGSESTIQLASNGPSPLTVQIVKKDTCQALLPGITPIPAEQLGHLTSTLNLSLNQAKKAATIIRSWKGRNSIETAAIDSLRSKDKDLKDFFDTKQLELMKTGGEAVTRDVVFCGDVEGLIHYLLEAMNVEGTTQSR